jgi:hypothetical protein
VTIAVAAIDSVRTVDIERAALLTHGLMLGFTVVALIVWRVSEGD